MALLSDNKKFSIHWLTAMLLCVMPIPSTYASDENLASSEVPADAQPDHPSEKTRRQLDLGPFQIRQLRPIRNETISTKFEITLVLQETATKAMATRLENWKHRFRDQVISSVRLTDSKDFSEPELQRLQRLILLRINRILKFTRIEKIYMTRFEFALQ